MEHLKKNRKGRRRRKERKRNKKATMNGLLNSRVTEDACHKI